MKEWRSLGIVVAATLQADWTLLKSRTVDKASCSLILAVIILMGNFSKRKLLLRIVLSMEKVKCVRASFQAVLLP